MASGTDFRLWKCGTVALRRANFTGPALFPLNYGIPGGNSANAVAEPIAGAGPIRAEITIVY